MSVLILAAPQQLALAAVGLNCVRMAGEAVGSVQRHQLPQVSHEWICAGATDLCVVTVECTRPESNVKVPPGQVCDFRSRVTFFSYNRKHRKMHASYTVSGWSFQGHKVLNFPVSDDAGEGVSFEHHVPDLKKPLFRLADGEHACHACSHPGKLEAHVEDAFTRGIMADAIKQEGGWDNCHRWLVDSEGELHIFTSGFLVLMHAVLRLTAGWEVPTKPLPSIWHRLSVPACLTDGTLHACCTAPNQQRCHAVLPM